MKTPKILAVKSEAYLFIIKSFNQTLVKGYLFGKRKINKPHKKPIKPII